jgi:hypothetical protein
VFETVDEAVERHHPAGHELTGGQLERHGHDGSYPRGRQSDHTE